MPARHEAEHGQHVFFIDRVAAKGNQLIERGLGIAQPTLRPARNRQQRVVVNGHAFRRRHQAQAFDNLSDRNAAQVEPLAARQDRRRNFLGVGGRKNELRVGRRFLERLQQGIEGRHAEHVHFVDDRDLEGPAGWRVAHGLAQVAHLIDAVVGCAVDFQHVQIVAGGDLATGITFTARRRRRPLLAIQRPRKNTRQRSFANSARADKQVRMREALQFNGVAQGLHHMILPDHIFKPLRAPLAR